MSICKRYIISGCVQGVFYRASTQKQAIKSNVKGWVRNRPDGCVEVMACSDTDNLEKFEAWLWQGPQLAEVKNVSTELQVYQPYDSFDIDYNDMGNK